MPLYVKKSFKIAPGLRVNVSKNGLGLSAGVKGARLSVGPRGVQINAGREGIYYRKSLGRRGRRRVPSVHRAHGRHTLLRLLEQILTWGSVLFVAMVVGALFTLSPLVGVLDLLVAVPCGLIAATVRRSAGGSPQWAACLAAAVLIGPLIIVQQMYYASSVAPRLRAARARTARQQTVWAPTTGNAVTEDTAQPRPWSYPGSYTMYCPYCAWIVPPTAVVCAHCCQQMKPLPDGTWLVVP